MSEILNAILRVIIYIRVSTKLQETKYSLSAQKEELTKYAKDQGWNIVATYRDIESGGKLEKEGMDQLLNDVEEGKTDVVLVMDQDRLSRLDVAEWEFLKSTLRDNKVKIAEPGNMVDLDNEDDEFISDIKNLIARREKRAVVKRMMRGKRQRMRDGKGWGKAPLGYIFNKETKVYEIDDDWAWVIPTIDEMYLEKNMGMKAIADKLNEVSKTPSGTHWNETLVYRRLVSKAFHGVMEKNFANGETIAISDIYPKLRTVETWEEIQEEREKRAKVYKADQRQNDNIHMLRKTYIKCGMCNRKIHVANHGGKTTPRYYLKHGRKLCLKDRSVCNISINTIRLDDNIIRAVKEILTNEELAKKYIMIDIDEEEIPKLKSQIKKSQKVISQIEEKQDRLLDLYLNGVHSKEKLAEKDEEFKRQLDHQKKIYNQQKAKLETLEKQEWNYDLLYQYLEIAESMEYELTPNERVQMIGDLFPEAILYEDRIVLIAELHLGFPIEIEVKIDEDPYLWHHTKEMS
ncbi:recombinase family protein [Rossellomorea aquimaris]|uniref:recombinase family protein n=1 Tax=Rossellomorea aquimaris TaxID=189382 RepID=UPI0007D0AE86|nr:recombinase family protein [Rossellomorea aquimaris]